MVRALVSTSTFPLGSAPGVPRFAWDLARSLTPHCRSVAALVPGAPGVGQWERSDGVDISRFSYFWPHRLQVLAYGQGMVNNLRRSNLAKLQVPAFLAAQVAAVRRSVDLLDIEVVNSHWLVPQGLSSAIGLANRRSVAHVLSVHAADVYLLRRLPFGRQIAKWVVDRADFVFADGSHVRDALDALLGRPSGARLQPMGVSLDRFRNAEPLGERERKYPGGFVLFVGRFVEKKGVAYLIRGFSRVRESHPGLGLVLVGYGPLEGDLRAEVGRLGLHEAVEFAGPRGHDQVARFLASCRAIAVPSIVDRNGETEGMPTVVVEAMAAGARVVGSAVNGIPDVVRSRVNGWLCRPRDSEDLAEKLIEALESPECVARDAAIQTTADAFDWPRLGEIYSSAFIRAVESRRRIAAGRHRQCESER